jgi:hypothetical protein
MNSAALALTSAFAGAVGALGLRTLVKLGGRALASRFPLAVYGCVPDGDAPGLFQHGWGEEVEDERTRSKATWLYTLKPIPRREGKHHEHTLFGPYVNNFGRPGYFEIRFRVAAEDLDNSDHPIVVLDVIQAPFDLERNHLVLGQKVIRCAELAKEYRIFGVAFYAAGSGVYEYRATVLEREFRLQMHQNKQNKGTEPKIRFDEVTVHSKIPLWELI